MKVITEAILRDELRASVPETYTVPEGKILSPAAREFLQQNKVKILDGKKVSYQKEKKQDKEEKEDKRPDVKATEVPPMPTVSAEEDKKPRFVDYETGAFYFEKPEHMTHLYGNVLVPKDHKRIYFRGKTGQSGDHIRPEPDPPSGNGGGPDPDRRSSGYSGKSSGNDALRRYG